MSTRRNWRRQNRRKKRAHLFSSRCRRYRRCAYRRPCRKKRRPWLHLPPRHREHLPSSRQPSLRSCRQTSSCRQPCRQQQRRQQLRRQTEQYSRPCPQPSHRYLQLHRHRQYRSHQSSHRSFLLTHRRLLHRLSRSQRHPTRPRWHHRNRQPPYRRCRVS